MNKTESVSIGRKGFVCESDAYKVLQDYLARSEKRLRSDPDKKDILADLELSMAGHLSELTGELVVDKQTAEKVVELMGEVEVTESSNGNESESEDTQTPDDASFSERMQSLVKKPLYKDHERAIGDGVCAGLAKALGIDPVWVRIAFVILLLITQGFMFVVYIVLMVVMKDESDFKKKTAGEVIGDVRSKLLVPSESSPIRTYERVLRQLVLGVAKAIWTLLRIVVCAVLVACAIAWASVLFFMLSNPAQVDVFGGNPGWLGFTAVFSAGLLLLIPLFELLLALFGMAKSRSRFTMVLWSMWALSLITFVGSIANLYPKIETYLKTERPKNDFVYVQMAGNEIASLCFSPLGTCSDSEQVLTYEPICGRNMTVYDKDDRVVWLSRGWEPRYESIEYPASEDVYCARLRTIFDQNVMMVARQTLNDRAYVSKDYTDMSSPDFPQGISVPSDKEYWQFEYLIKSN